MPREVVVFGVMMPAIVPLCLLCLAAMWWLDKFLSGRALYRYVWHPPLFRLALFILLFSLAGLLVYRLP